MRRNIPGIHGRQQEGGEMRGLMLLLLTLGFLSATMAEAQECKIRPERFSFIWENGAVLVSGTWVREGSTPYDNWNFLARSPSNFSQVECNIGVCRIATAYVLGSLLTLDLRDFKVQSWTDETIIATFALNPNTVLSIRRSDKSVTVDSTGVITKEHKRESLRDRHE